jgi:hypothetical protein
MFPKFSWKLIDGAGAAWAGRAVMVPPRARAISAARPAAPIMVLVVVIAVPSF